MNFLCFTNHSDLPTKPTTISNLNVMLNNNVITATTSPQTILITISLLFFQDG